MRGLAISRKKKGTDLFFFLILPEKNKSVPFFVGTAVSVAHQLPKMQGNTPAFYKTPNPTSRAKMLKTQPL